MSTDQSSNYQNDNIKISLARKPGCRIHLDVEVSPQATEACYQKAIKTLTKDISVPGFRKGKAPKDLILKNYASYIEKEWKDTLLNTSFQEALSLTKIYPYRQESIQQASIKNFSKEAGSHLVFEYEAAPEVPSISTENLSIPTIKRKDVAEKDVEEAINDLRLQHADWQDIVDRSVQEGDFVDIDIDGINPEHSICKNTRLKVEEGKMGAWMRKLLIGMTAGNSVEGMSEKEEDHSECQACDAENQEHHHDHSDFVPKLCRITLHAVKNATPAPLDDALAKKFGANSVDELKERVKINLNKRSDEHQRNHMRRLMEKELLQKYPFDIPLSLIQNELKEKKNAIKEDLKAGGQDDTTIKSEVDKLDAQIIGDLDHDYRLFFITQKVAHDNKIEVSQEEVMRELMRQMWMQQLSENAIDPSDMNRLQSQLHLQIMSIKALDYLIDHTESFKKA